MATELKKLEAWKRRARELAAQGRSAGDAVREAITENVPRYIEVLEECGFDDAAIVRLLVNYTLKGKKR